MIYLLYLLALSWLFVSSSTDQLQNEINMQYELIVAGNDPVSRNHNANIYRRIGYLLQGKKESNACLMHHTSSICIPSLEWFYSYSLQ